jgi:3-deoxy-7-phosphoheptulonate synthase
VNTESDTFTQAQFFTAHECLLLPYEQALTRMDSTTGRWYGAAGAHTFDPLRRFNPDPSPNPDSYPNNTPGPRYDCSAHMVWIGERTRQLDCAHVEFCRGLGNPIGIKISDKCDPAELVTLCQTLNPNNIPGRITIIVRMGAEKVVALHKADARGPA